MITSGLTKAPQFTQTRAISCAMVYIQPTVGHQDQHDDQRLHKRAPAALAAGQGDQQVHDSRHQQDL